MTPLQIVVLIAFLLILGGAAAYILFTGRNRMKNDPTRKEQFDERQKSARGFACFAALGSLAVGRVDHRRAGGAGRPADADAPG